MASEPREKASLPENSSLEEIGTLYSAVKMESWEEAHDAFERFVMEFKKGFGSRQDPIKAMEAYDEMMEKSIESMALETDNYDGDDRDVHHVKNAFVYGGNSEPNVNEFRESVSSIIKEEKEWADYAERSQR